MLRVERLSKRYGTLTAIHDLSFEVARGEIVGLLGPNGSGKSTTVKILTALLPATSGVVTLDGQPAFDDLIAYKAKLGYVPEEPLSRSTRAVPAAAGGVVARNRRLYYRSRYVA